MRRGEKQGMSKKMRRRAAAVLLSLTFGGAGVWMSGFTGLADCVVVVGHVEYEEEISGMEEIKLC